MNTDKADRLDFKIQIIITLSLKTNKRVTQYIAKTVNVQIMIFFLISAYNE